MYDQPTKRPTKQPRSNPQVTTLEEVKNNNTTYTRKSKLIPNLQIFCDMWSDKFGQQYHVGDFAKAQTQAKRLPRFVNGDYEKTVAAYLNSSDPVIGRSGHNFSMFITQINAFRPKRKVAVDPADQILNGGDDGLL